MQEISIIMKHVINPLKMISFLFQKFYECRQLMIKLFPPGCIAQLVCPDPTGRLILFLKRLKRELQ